MAAAKKKKKRKEEVYPWKAGASSGHITNLKQSILDFRYLWFYCILFLINILAILAYVKIKILTT